MEKSVNRQQALSLARARLAGSGVEDAPLEGELLLRHVLGMDRARLYLDIEGSLDPADEREYFKLVERRCRGEPSAYITGHREFYGLDFLVDASVLIPRPETEHLVDEAINLAQQRSRAIIADIGTGCGAIAVTLARHLPEAEVYATDVSAPALEVARGNCRRHGVAGRVCLLHGELLDPLPGPVDLLIANLPYVAEKDIPRTGPLSYEPVMSLNGGPDGLDIIRKLCRQAGGKLCPGGALLLEVGQGQAEAVPEILRQSLPEAGVEVMKDYGGIARVVRACLTPQGA